jgi:hypothetical protein
MRSLATWFQAVRAARLAPPPLPVQVQVVGQGGGNAPRTNFWPGNSRRGSSGRWSTWSAADPGRCRDRGRRAARRPRQGVGQRLGQAGAPGEAKQGRVCGAGLEPMRTQLSAASPSEPRVAVRQWGPGSGVARGVAATLGVCCHEDWNPALTVWRGIRRLLTRRGEQAPAVAGPSLRPAYVEVARQPFAPFSSSTACFGVRS